MKTGLYVVTQAIEACGKSMEIVSPTEQQGGIFEDGTLALREMLKENEGEAMPDRFLYAASFEDGELRIGKLFFGLGYDRTENRVRILFEQ